MDKALERAAALKLDCLAMFVRNQVQWHVPPLRDAAAATFRRRREELGIGPIVAHGSYLVNLAGLADVRRKSVAAMKADLARCDRLGIEYLVFHPGSRSDAARGIRLIADALNRIVAAPRPAGATGKRPMILLETTAGQGSGIGHTFEQLADILSRLDQPECFGVCLDTCHVFAAGYDLRTPAAYRKTMRQFDAAIGLARLRAVHLNDARKDLASRVDRHAHIGAGLIGAGGFAHLVNDRRLTSVPMILETPKGRDDAGRDWDEVNVAAVRSLVRRRNKR